MADIYSKLGTIFFPASSNAKVGTVTLDLITDETYNYPADMTDFTVEDGSDIQDNIFLKPLRITLKGLISDSSLAFIATRIKDAVDQKNIESHKDLVLNELLQLRENKTPFDVVTGLKLFSNMFFENLDISRDKDSGNSFTFNFSLKQIKKVTKQTLENTKRPSYHKKTVDKGKVNIEPIPDPTKDDGAKKAGSIGYNLAEYYGIHFGG